MIRKVAEDALGKWVADAPQQLLGLLRTTAVARRRTTMELGRMVTRFLSTSARTLYRDVAWDLVGGSGREEIRAIRIGTLLFAYRGVPVLVQFHYRNDGPNEIEISALRGSLDLDDLLQQALQHRNCHRFSIVQHSGAGFLESKGRSYPGEDDDDIELEPEKRTGQMWRSPTLLRMLRDARYWHGARQWFRDRGLAWRCGMLEYGTPGNGKSANARAVAEELDIPMHVFSIANMSDTDFRRSWARVANDQPAMALIEDFDDTIRGRENIRNELGVAFSTIINCIGGVDGGEGVLLVMTTNDLSALDPALGLPDEHGESSRPGRIDHVYHVEAPTHEGRLHVAQTIVRDEAVALRLATEHEGKSLDQFRHICQQLALAEFWRAQA